MQNYRDQFKLGTKHGVYRHFENSSERKPRDFSGMRLTPNNRDKRIAQANSSRENSIDRSYRAFGISPS